MRPAAIAGFASIAGATLLAPPASPKEEPTPLAVQAAGGASTCPDAVVLAKLANDVSHHGVLEPHDASAPTPGVRILVEFARDAAGYAATIRVLGGARAGVRSLAADPGASCSDLAQAVAVTLAVMLDEGLPPPADSAGPAPSGTASAGSMAASASSEVSGDVAPRSLEPARAFGLAVAASGGALFGVVRDVAPYGTLELEARLNRRFQLGVGALAVLPQRFDEPGGSVEVSLYAAQLFGCATLLSPTSSGGIHGDLCALFAAGAIRGKTEGLAVNDDRTRTWLASAAYARLGGALVGPLAWSLRAGGLLQRPRETFDVRGAGPVYQPTVVGVFLGFGLSASIW